LAQQIDVLRNLDSSRRETPHTVLIVLPQVKAGLALIRLCPLERDRGAVVIDPLLCKVGMHSKVLIIEPARPQEDKEERQRHSTPNYPARQKVTETL
jgi:hypothetical protein